MNILIAADLYHPIVSGASYFVERLSIQMQNRGHKVIVLAPSESFAYTKKIINGVTVYGIRSWPIFLYKNFRMTFMWRYNQKIAKIFEEFQPDVVHCNFHLGVNRAVLKVAKRKGIRTVGTNHFMPETMLHYLPVYPILGPIMRKLAWLDFARVFRKMDKVTAPTQIAANLIASYFDKPVMPISCGIDLARFKPGLDTEYLYAKYNIPQKPVLLFVGRLDKEKNLDFVLRALKEALKDTNFQFVICGLGAEEKNLRKLASSLGINNSVSFTGFVAHEDLPSLYCLAECFIMPGTAELQSIATMEAMGCGLPVLAVDAVALPELVKDGENGFLFSLINPAVLAHHIQLLFFNKAIIRKMSTKSSELINQHSIDKIMEKFELIYLNTSQKHGFSANSYDLTNIA